MNATAAPVAVDLRCPYPGLRPFRRTEAAFFYGRDTHVEILLDHLARHSFLAVLGASGSGKSSLVRAGLIPALEAGLSPTGHDWRWFEFRPGESPLENLADALAGFDSEVAGNPALRAADRQDYARELALGHDPLAGLCEKLLPDQTTHLLILVDQFEELFRFRDPVIGDDDEDDGGMAEQKSAAIAPEKSATRRTATTAPGDALETLPRQQRLDEADIFINILLAAAKHPRISVILTMRSEYLGDCAKFPGLTEAINESHYLTPRLTRPQMAAAIARPAEQHGVTVEPALVNRLINDAGADSDQLPLLQHTLARLWNLFVITRATTTLTLKLYDDRDGRIRTLAHCLDDHAEELFRDLTPAQQHITERLFRALSERGRFRRDTRRMSSADEIARLIAADRALEAADVLGMAPAVVTEPGQAPPHIVEEVLAVIEVFRREDVSMLVFIPETGDPRDPNTMVDITHESVLRQWRRLRDCWIPREACAADGYREYRKEAKNRWLRPGQTGYGVQYILQRITRFYLRCWPLWTLPAGSRARHLRHYASAKQEFKAHLDNLDLESARSWRDAGHPHPDDFYRRSDTPRRTKTRTGSCAILTTDGLPEIDERRPTAAWAQRYDRKAWNNFPLALRYIGESQVRCASENAEKFLMRNIAVISLLCFALAGGMAGYARYRETAAKEKENTAVVKAAEADRKAASAEADKGTAVELAAAATAQQIAATAEADKATAATAEAHLMLATGAWRDGLLLDAAPHLARAAKLRGNRPLPLTLADELPPPVMFSHAVKHGPPPQSLVVDPDGNWVAVLLQDGSVDVLEPQKRETVAHWPKKKEEEEEGGHRLSLVPNPGGAAQLLLWTTPADMQLLDAPALKPTAAPSWMGEMQKAAGKRRFLCLSFSEDGSRAAAVLNDGTLVFADRRSDKVQIWKPARETSETPFDRMGTETFGTPVLLALNQQGNAAVVADYRSKLRVATPRAAGGDWEWVCPPFTPPDSSEVTAIVFSPFHELDDPPTPKGLRFLVLNNKANVRTMKVWSSLYDGAPKSKKEKPAVSYVLESEKATEFQTAARIGGTATGQNRSKHRLRAWAQPPAGKPDFSYHKARENARLSVPLRGAPAVWTDKDGSFTCWWENEAHSTGETWPSRQVVTAHEGEIHGCVISPDATWIASCGADGFTRFWRVADDGKRQSEARERARDWTNVRWSGASAAAWSFEGGVISVRTGGKEIRQPASYLQQLGKAPGISDFDWFLGDDALLVSANGSTALWRSLEGIRVIDASNPGNPPLVLPANVDEDQPLAISPSGRRFALVTGTGRLGVFDSRTGQRVPSFPSVFSGKVPRLTFGGSDDCLCLHLDAVGILVLLESGETRPMAGADLSLREESVALGENGKRIVAADFVIVEGKDQFRFVVFDWSGTAWETKFIPVQARFSHSGFLCSPDATWAAWTGEDGTIHRMRFSEGKETPTKSPFPATPGFAAALAVANDGSLLAASGAQIYRWGGNAADPVAEPLPIDLDWRPHTPEKSAEDSGLVLDGYQTMPDAANPGGSRIAATDAAALEMWRALAITNAAEVASMDDWEVPPKSEVETSKRYALLRWIDDPANAKHSLHDTAVELWMEILDSAGLELVDTDVFEWDPPPSPAEMPAAIVTILEKLETELETRSTILRGGFSTLKDFVLIVIRASLDNPGAAARFRESKLYPTLITVLEGAADQLFLELPLLMTDDLADLSESLDAALLELLTRLTEPVDTTWARPAFKALLALAPHKDSKGEMVLPPPAHWKAAAAAAAIAVERLEQTPDCIKAARLQPIALMAGRLALLAGDKSAAAPFLETAASFDSLSAGHLHMKALALALLDDRWDEALAVLEPLETPPAPDKEAADELAPLFHGAILLLRAEDVQAADSAAAEQFRNKAKEKLANSSGLEGMFQSTPELWPLAKQPLLRKLLEPAPPPPPAPPLIPDPDPEQPKPRKNR